MKPVAFARKYASITTDDNGQ